MDGSDSNTKQLPVHKIDFIHHFACLIAMFLYCYYYYYYHHFAMKEYVVLIIFKYMWLRKRRYLLFLDNENGIKQGTNDYTLIIFDIISAIVLSNCNWWKQNDYIKESRLEQFCDVKFCFVKQGMPSNIKSSLNISFSALQLSVSSFMHQKTIPQIIKSKMKSLSLITKKGLKLLSG